MLGIVGTVTLVFFVAVLAQTLLKRYNKPLLSDYLVVIKNTCIDGFTRFGRWVARWVNVYEWWRWVRRNFKRIWNWIVRNVTRLWNWIRDYIWDFLKPFLDSTWEIAKPLWQIIFSPIYFCVGFASTHYIIFSNLGLMGLVGGAVYWTREWSVPLILMYWSVYWNYVVGTAVFVAVGTLVAYPRILPSLFPRVSRIFQ
jgi:hypothetical protein